MKSIDVNLLPLLDKWPVAELSEDIYSWVLSPDTYLTFKKFAFDFSYIIRHIRCVVYRCHPYLYCRQPPCHPKRCFRFFVFTDTYPNRPLTCLRKNSYCHSICYGQKHTRGFQETKILWGMSFCSNSKLHLSGFLRQRQIPTTCTRKSTRWFREICQKYINTFFE